MPVGATIGAIGSVASAGIGAFSSYNASKSQADAANNALAFQKQIYSQNQNNLSPWMKTGSQAFQTLGNLYGMGPNGAQGVNEGWDAFKNLDAYKFPQQQGLLAMDRQLNAQGRQLSGAQVRGAQQFGQGLASQYMMGNYVNPLMQMAGMGQSAATSLAGSNVASGAQIGQSYGNLGAAQAAGSMGIGNAISGGIGGATNNLALYSMLGQGGGGTSPTYNLGGANGSGGMGNFLTQGGKMGFGTA